MDVKKKPLFDAKHVVYVVLCIICFYVITQMALVVVMGAFRDESAIMNAPSLPDDQSVTRKLILNLLLLAVIALIGGIIGYIWASRPLTGRPSITIRAGCIGMVLGLCLNCYLTERSIDRDHYCYWMTETEREAFRGILIFGVSGALVGTFIGLFIPVRKIPTTSLPTNVNLNKFHLQRDRVTGEKDCSD